jgi:hypothetical protein
MCTRPLHPFLELSLQSSERSRIEVNALMEFHPPLVGIVAHLAVSHVKFPSLEYLSHAKSSLVS